MNVDDLIGKPFEFGATGPEAYDCWALVTEVARRVGLILPDINRPVEVDLWDAQCDRHLNVDFQRIERPEPLAIVAMRVEDHWHAGIVLPGVTQFIHSVRNHRVSAPRLTSALWQPLMEGFYRYVGNGHIHP